MADPWPYYSCSVVSRRKMRAAGFAVYSVFLYAVYSVLKKREINELIRNDNVFFITLNKFTRRRLRKGELAPVHIYLRGVLRA